MDELEIEQPKILEEPLDLLPDLLTTEEGRVIAVAATERLRRNAALAGAQIGRVEVHTDHPNKRCVVRGVIENGTIGDDVDLDLNTVPVPELEGDEE